VNQLVENFELHADSESPNRELLHVRARPTSCGRAPQRPCGRPNVRELCTTSLTRPSCVAASLVAPPHDRVHGGDAQRQQGVHTAAGLQDPAMVAPER
jgi:hypothetical protein